MSLDYWLHHLAAPSAVASQRQSRCLCNNVTQAGAMLLTCSRINVRARLQLAKTLTFVLAGNDQGAVRRHHWRSHIPGVCWLQRPHERNASLHLASNHRADNCACRPLAFHSRCVTNMLCLTRNLALPCVVFVSAWWLSCGYVLWTRVVDGSMTSLKHTAALQAGATHNRA